MLPGISSTVYDRTIIHNQILALLTSGLSRGEFDAAYSYDGAGRLNGISVSGLVTASVAITYNANDQVTQAVISIQKVPPDFPDDRVVTINYTYDADGILDGMSQTEIP